MATRYSHRNLIVWQHAQKLAIRIIKITQQLPNSWVNAVIARQIISSATSVGANIAEGHGRFTPGAHRNHLSIAKGSLAETGSWRDLLRRMGTISEQEELELAGECDEINAMLLQKFHKLSNIDSDGQLHIEEATVVYEIHDDLPIPPFTNEDYAL